MTLELLRAFSKAGNYVAGAFDGRHDGRRLRRLLPRPERGRAAQPHRRASRAAATGRSIGFALKLHQRAWALGAGSPRSRGRSTRWSARNAYFNLVKLGARAGEYLPNFYGADDRRHQRRGRLRPAAGALAAARPAVVARLRRRRAAPSAADELARGAVVALSVAEDGEPVPGRLDGAMSLVAVPRTSSALRAADPGAGPRWRLAAREALMPLVAGGGRIEGFDRAGWYVVRRRRAPMKITGVELRRISMPLVAPFRTSFGTETDRDILLVRVVTRRTPRAGASAWP